MARIICFADNAAVVNAVQQGLGEGNHTIHLLSASQLTSSLRQTVQHIAPDIILLELSHATDNPHLYFFLRADSVTRNTPIILVSAAGKPLAQQAEILGADGYIERPLITEQLRRVVTPHLLSRRIAAA